MKVAKYAYLCSKNNFLTKDNDYIECRLSIQINIVLPCYTQNDVSFIHGVVFEYSSYYAVYYGIERIKNPDADIE